MFLSYINPLGAMDRIKMAIAMAKISHPTVFSALTINPSISSKICYFAQMLVFLRRTKGGVIVMKKALFAIFAAFTLSGCATDQNGYNGLQRFGMALQGTPRPQQPYPQAVYEQRVYPAENCVGPVIMGVCHGTVIQDGPAKICHGQMVGGQCTGPMF